jgi:ribosomal peptide maturation radical SAM protein 1
LEKRVAIVKMPWSPAHLSCITSGLLKALLARQNISADVFYLNLRLARRLNFAQYELIHHLPVVMAETVFADLLFDRPVARDWSEVCHELLLSETVVHRFRPDVFGSLKSDEKQVAALLNQLSREIIPEFIGDSLTQIAWSDYKVVGFVSAFDQHVASLALARKIKERFPGIKIVFGGANVWGSMGRETLRAFHWVDYVIDGEGDRSFPRLVGNILAGAPFTPVPGVSYQRDGRLFISQERYPPVDMDELPVPDYSDFSRELASNGLVDKAPRPAYLFESSRGCWWGEKMQCTFCGVNGPTLKYRRKSSANVMREIVQAAEHGARNFIATDSVVNPELCRTLFPSLKRYQADSGRKFSLFYEVVAGMTKEELLAMREGGVNSVQAGIESLDSDLLRLLRKGTTVLDNIRFLKWCRELKLNVIWIILHSIPGERTDYYERMLSLLPLVSHLEPPAVLLPVQLQRYSAYHEKPDQFGLTNIRPLRAYKHIYPPDKVNIDELAYYFDYDGGSFGAEPTDYLDALRTAIYEWTQKFYGKRAFFEYTITEAGDVVELLDRRGGEIIPRRLVLCGLKAKIFLYCDSVRLLPEIKVYLAEQGDDHITDEDLQILLADLTAEEIIYGENGRYLSLATYRSPEKSTLFAKIPV